MARTPSDNLRTEIYPMCLNLMRKHSEMEAYILILSTWNFASFRYVMKTFSLRKFKRSLKKIEPIYKKLGSLSFKSIDLDRYEREIKIIYSSLSAIPGIKYTGAPKIMHLKNPKLFVMWDDRIKRYYGLFKGDAKDYINFFRLMQKKFKNHKVRKGMTLARTVDLINMERITEKVLKEKEGKKKI